MTFLGKYYNSIDSKNRVIVPSKFREKLGGLGCVITRGRDRCLEIYTAEDWEKQLQKYEDLPQSDHRVRDFLRDQYGNGQECSFDKQGRIIIPQHLIEFAGIDKELITLGVMNKVEIWSKEIYEGPKENRRLDQNESYDDLIEYGV